MKNATKIIGGLAIVALLIYLYKKYKKDNEVANALTQPAGANTDNAQVGSSSTGTRKAVVSWKDTTRRRCIDANGHTYYVNGPCDRV